MVGGPFRNTLRWICRDARRGRATGARGRRFRGHRRMRLQRQPWMCSRGRGCRTAAASCGGRGMSAPRLAAAALLLLAGFPIVLAASAAAQAPLQLGPATTTAAPKAGPKPAARKLLPRAPAVEQPVATAASDPEADLAYGAFQRGYYMTAFALATRRVEEKNDVKAMTLLGEMYANGFGIDRNDKKAAEWYQFAADRGDREAMFALGMFHLGGRLGAVNS